jgi:hypothetical protein
MFSVGDIVQIFAPQAGHKKFHLCVLVGLGGGASQFIYLNSDPTFDQTYVVDCKRVPCLPVSKTGKTAFTFAILPRYNDRQLTLYRAKKLGELDPILARELRKFAESVTTLNSADRSTVLAALDLVIARSS